MTSVIRVKRKRLSEPAEALLLARKKAKNDWESQPTKSDMADIIKIEEKVFHFAGTVEPEYAHSEHVVAERVKEAMHHRDQQKSNMRATSRKRKLPRFVSDTCHNLPKIKQIKDSTIAICQSVLREKCLNLSPEPKVHFKSKEAVTDAPKKHVLQSSKNLKGHADYTDRSMYDEEKSAQRFKTDTYNEDSIMCNNIKMLREKLNISENPAKPDVRSEFVYDLYYCKDPASNWDMTDLLYVQPYRYNEEDMLMLSSSEEEYFDDEDDSNDEDNWRNDYPDDEDSSGSSSTSEDEWERFIQQEEEDMENDDDDLDAGGDDSAVKFGEDDHEAFDYHDEFEAEVAFNCYDDDPNEVDNGDGDN